MILLALGLACWIAELHRRLELVARAEHELRGPVAVVSLAAERMKREPAGRRHALALDAELERLRAGLADLTAARGGRRRLGRPRRSELEPLVRSAVEAWRAAGLPMHLDWRAGRATVLADRGRLAQAVGNLLANAAEHGEGPVELSAERRGRAVRVEVRNRGRGLRIASDAAREAGGSVRVVAALELPDAA
ncbi:MAG TPA: ATP-binding protein [Thermoleophilaceae bacterium]